MIYTIVLFDEQGQVDETIAFDAVTGFDESYTSTIPQSAVESGYSLSDSIVKSNDKFTLSGVITDSLFRRKGALLQYVNGRFVRIFEDIDPIGDDNPVITMKARLKKLRDDREIFGIFESLRGANETETTQVNLIYPCALTDIGFSNKDGGNAIYPNMSFERIRVATVSFDVVKNPSPELIPHIKHGNAGNQTGASGSVDVPDVKVDPSLKEQTDAGKSAVPKELKKDEGWADKKIKAMNKEEDALRASIKYKKQADEMISNGTMRYGESGQWIDAQIDKDMKAKYGGNWNK